LKENLKKITRYETENKVDTTPNHLTGFLDKTVVDKHDFQRERLAIENSVSKKSKK
jgi:hypothetical protein